MAGLALAISLRQRSSRSVYVVAGRSANLAGEILPPSVKRELRMLGCLDALAECLEDVGGVKADWGDGGLFERSYIGSPFGSALSIDKHCFIRVLAKTAEDLGVVIARGQIVKTMLRNSTGGWKVVLDNGETLDSEIVVNASGRGNLSGFSNRHRFDRLCALCVYGTPTDWCNSWDSSLLIEAVEIGWWYSVRLPNRRAIIALLTDNDLITSSANVFIEESVGRTKHTNERWRGLQNKGRVVGRTASTSYSENIIEEDYIAIGDAVYTGDPLRGHGVKRALQNGIEGAEWILSYSYRKEAEFTNFAQKHAQEFMEYLGGLKDYYAQERRWRHLPFWKRRIDLADVTYSTDGKQTPT